MPSGRVAALPAGGGRRTLLTQPPGFREGWVRSGRYSTTADPTPVVRRGSGSWCPVAERPPALSIAGCQNEAVRRAVASSDDRLLAQLRAAPDLSEGIQSLAYWHERRRRLAWYRVLARREAMRMIVRWEHRVQEAILSQRGVPIAIRASAGMLLARTRVWRWSRRAVVAVSAVLSVSLLAAPFVAVLLLVIHAL